MAAHDFRTPRLYVEAPLAAGAALPLARAQANYLINVLHAYHPAFPQIAKNWDLTATLTDPLGAKQAGLQGTGYFGPCPMGTTHAYQFTVYAIPNATLSGNTSSASTARAAARAVAIAMGNLKGTSNAGP